MSDTPVEIKVDTPAVVIKVPTWRSKLINILQIAGSVAGVIGSADLIQAINVIPDIPNSVSVWLAIIGTFTRFTAEPIIKLVGDYADDGIKNDSFKINP